MSGGICVGVLCMCVCAHKFLMSKCCLSNCFYFYCLNLYIVYKQRDLPSCACLPRLPHLPHLPHACVWVNHLGLLSYWRHALVASAFCLLFTQKQNPSKLQNEKWRKLWPRANASVGKWGAKPETCFCKAKLWTHLATALTHLAKDLNSSLI